MLGAALADETYFLLLGVALSWGLVFLGLCDLYRSLGGVLRVSTAMLLSLPLAAVIGNASVSTSEGISRALARDKICSEADLAERLRVHFDQAPNTDQFKQLEACRDLYYRLGLGYNPTIKSKWQE